MTERSRVALVAWLLVAACGPQDPSPTSNPTPTPTPAPETPQDPEPVSACATETPADVLCPPSGIPPRVEACPDFWAPAGGTSPSFGPGFDVLNFDIGRIEPAASLDYLELWIDAYGDEPEAWSRSGVLCSAASDVDACLARYEAERGAGGAFYEYCEPTYLRWGLVANRGDDVWNVGRVSELRQLFGTLVSNDDAALYVHATHPGACGGERVGSAEGRWWVLSTDLVDLSPAISHEVLSSLTPGFTWEEAARRIDSVCCSCDI